MSLGMENGYEYLIIMGGKYLSARYWLVFYNGQLLVVFYV